ncbi:MAG: radical SAM family heme chaperone HemW [Roseburia sp.]|nr:radical SAM family heme chaperone HemW [Roseburia sp.]
MGQERKPSQGGTGGGELELYLHIPFCVKKCNYCDFLSAPADREVREAYISAMCQEIRGRAQEAEAYKVSSIFVGGGTPSLLEPEQFVELFDNLREAYHLMHPAEITLEANPGTLDKAKLEAYRECGVNRLSMGLQSTVDEELRTLGRIHSYRQFLESYQLAREEGFTNINVDLMSSLPGQTTDSYRKGLQRILELSPAPEHISAYSLILEEGTPFYERHREGSLMLPTEEEDREMYRLTGELLGGAGYERYEISNYARPGFACRHNKGYWQRKNYLGFGIGAASLMENQRFANSGDLRRYLSSPMGARGERQTLCVQEQMEETMFLGLRLMQGISLEAFEESFGCKLETVYREPLERNIRDGLLHLEGGRVSLTQRGIDVSNYVMAQFLFDERPGL